MVTTTGANDEDMRETWKSKHGDMIWCKATILSANEQTRMIRKERWHL